MKLFRKCQKVCQTLVLGFGSEYTRMLNREKKNPDSKRDFVIMPTLHYHVPRSIDSIKGVQ